MEEINYLAVLVCGVLSMVVGSFWYGPLFGRKWMEICKVSPADIEARKKMQKEAMPLYIVQFVLVLFQAAILSDIIHEWAEMGSIVSSLWIWAGFVMTTIAGTAMWNNNPNKVKWAQFLIQSGYQLVMFVLFGYVLSVWR